MSSKVHSQGKVPFSWEKKPGESKVTSQQDHHNYPPPKILPPPPCPPENNSRPAFHDMKLPPPPCAFPPPPSRSSSRRGLKNTDDPFLIAIKEVTKKSGKGKSSSGGKVDQRFGFKKNMSIFSCKESSCSVTEDTIVRLSSIPTSRSREREGDNYSWGQGAKCGYGHGN